jgi:hypothetical protein
MVVQLVTETQAEVMHKVGLVLAAVAQVPLV